MKQKGQVRSYQRKTKSGKTITVKAHSRKGKGGASSRAGAGKGLEKARARKKLHRAWDLGGREDHRESETGGYRKNKKGQNVWGTDKNPKRRKVINKHMRKAVKSYDKAYGKGASKGAISKMDSGVGIKYKQGGSSSLTRKVKRSTLRKRGK